MDKELEKINELKQRRDKLNADINRRLARHSAKKRKEDTRRKILIGAMILAKANSDEVYEKELLESLGVFLDKPADRALFDLPPKAE